MAVSPETIPAMVWDRVRSDGPRTILREKQRGIWRAVSWTELGERMRGVTLGLIAAAFRPGEVACVLAETRPSWVFADLGILAGGGVSTGIHPTAGTDLVADILRDCGARVLFVENEEQLDKALHARRNCPSLERIVIFDMKGLRGLDDPMCESLSSFVARGAASGAAGVRECAARLASLRPESLAMLIYTTGTTGTPKGAMLSHRNILFQVEHAARLLGQHPGDQRLGFMPMAHVMERILGLYLALYTKTISNYAESADAVLDNLREIRPTVLAAPPHVWERFHARVSLAAEAATLIQRLLFRRAVSAGRQLADGRASNRRVPAWVSAEAAPLNRLVLGNVRRELGLDRLRLGLIGGAPVSPELIRWFMALGINLTEFYGQTECAGLASLMPADAPRLGTAGRPVPYGGLAIAENGEILLRGSHVFMGYRNRPEETAQALHDGWLHTGDRGALHDGYLTITGRIGETASASQIEKELKVSPYIADAVLFEAGTDFPLCLVMIDHDAVEAWATSHDVPFTDFRALARAPAVQELIGQEIGHTLSRLGQPGLIRRFRLIEHKLEPEDPELTPVMNLRRGVVAEKYRALIEDMRLEPPSDKNEREKPCAA